MIYRREIDGLRAVAVVPVIFFHAGFEAFSGGFVGVDVFFVISGYLITTIILTEKDQGTFSIAKFYERRARRILPALFLVTLVSIPPAWLMLLPRDMKDFSQSLVAVSTFASNILFWIETDYFGVENELKPLLHTWSLSVEEQYYVLFPLFLTLVWKLRKRWVLGFLALIGMASLTLAEWGVHTFPTASFFLLPFRAWELMIGAVIAFYMLYKKNQFTLLNEGNLLSQILSIAGILMIAYSVLIFDSSSPFPGVYALVPTIGAALIIFFSHPGNIVGSILGSSTLVGIGLVSYSAYLWHQPLFAFARHMTLSNSSGLYIALSVISMILAFLSWRFVETPFRKREKISKEKILVFSIVGTFLFILIGLTGHLTQGFKERFNENPDLIDIDNRLRSNYGLGATCGKANITPECKTSEQPEVLIWGDSYAMHLAEGFVSSNSSIKLLQRTRSVCAPFENLAPIITPKYPRKWARECLKFNHSVIELLRDQSSIKYVVLSSPFAAYLDKRNKLLLGERIVDAGAQLAYDEFLKTLATIEDLGIRPVVFSPTPSTGIDIGRCLRQATFYRLGLTRCDFNEADISSQNEQAFNLLQRIENSGFKVIWLNKLLCENGVCMTSIDSELVFRDSGHLSYEGSAKLGRLFDFYNLITEK